MRALRLQCALAFLAATGTGKAVTIDRLVLGTAADESSCAVTKVSEAIASTESQVYLRFQALRVRNGDRVQVDWMDPRGQSAANAVYEELPTAADLCFLTALPVGGFPAASQPGTWSVRIQTNGVVALTKPFRITGELNPSGVRITSVERLEGELRLEGEGFITDSVVHLAQYNATGGWTYIQSTFAATVVPGALTVRVPALEPAEYLIIVRNPDGRDSPPARFVIATTNGYRLPVSGGSTALVTQGPYGFSHYGNSQHAYDIVPGRGSCIVAMRSGTVHTYDLRLGRTPSRRIFGNYLTIEHGDGEFSHYAHLSSGTFQVRDGQKVDQGQPLALMGNSGYTLGAGGGYHVHVHVTRSPGISSGSIPFRFEELPLTPRSSFKGALQSSNSAGRPSCGETQPIQELSEVNSGSVALAQWWDRTIPVPAGAATLEVRLEWEGDPAALNLLLISPAGRQHGAYGEDTGYSGAAARPETLRLSAPEQGEWRIAVHGVGGNGELVKFRLTSKVAPSKARPVGGSDLAVAVR